MTKKLSKRLLNFKLQFMGARGCDCQRKPPSEREGDHEVVEGACGLVRQKSFHRNAFSLSRHGASSLPEGALLRKSALLNTPTNQNFSKHLQIGKIFDII